MTKIVINIEHSKDASALNEDNIIHQKEFKKAILLIDEKLESIDLSKKNENNKEQQQLHDTITILGTRGSGKTTFLKSILNHYEHHPKIQPIAIVDPTLIEEKGHIFLTFVSVIKKIVDEHIELEKCSNDEEREWEEKVNNLAYGIPTLDGVGKGLGESNWQDPNYILEKGLRSVDAAFNLCSTFHDFITFALRILNKKDAFIVAFDDIDVDFRKGWPVLEMIRKYFTTNRIIVLLSGDLRLYSLAIRKEKWKNFGKALLINEGKYQNKNNYYNDMVTEMEGQYMLKVLKPERRIHLTPLSQKIDLKIERGIKIADEYLIKYNDDTSETLILKDYKDILSHFGINNSYQADSYLTFLLGLPIRTQIQILADYYNNKNKPQQINIFDPFLSDLIEKSVDTALLSNSEKLVNVEILKLLLREKELSDLYQLQPTITDASLNATLFSLSIFLSSNISKHPYLIFDYFIKIGYVRNLLSEIPYSDSEEITNPGITIDRFCKHSGVYQDKVLRDILGNMNAYISGNITGEASKFGLITLQGLGLKSKKGKEEIGTRIDNIFLDKKVSKANEILGLMPLTISQSVIGNRSIPIYSIYTLLASIGEIVRVTETGDLEKALVELSQIRTYLVPEFKKGVNEGADSEEPNFNDVLKNDNSIEALLKEIKTWSNQFDNTFKISPHLLGKISTRFYFALNSIEKAEKQGNLGALMHNRIIAFMNAVLLEDARENVTHFSNFNNNNTNLSDAIFIANLTAASSGNFRKNLQLSKWIISCPLLLNYLKLSSQLKEKIIHFTRIDENNFTEGNQLNKLLDKVVVNKFNLSSRLVVNSSLIGFIKVAEKLRDRGVPFSPFEWKANVNPKMTARENIEANKILYAIIGERWDQGKLRRFRERLHDERFTW